MVIDNKEIEPQACKCGAIPKLIQWFDTEPKFTNATWIECECGMLTVSFYSKNPKTAREKAVKMWNKTSKRKKTKKGLRSCEKCGSIDLEVIVNQQSKPKGRPAYKTVMIMCNGCGLATDDLHRDGTVMTEKSSKELWNR